MGGGRWVSAPTNSPRQYLLLSGYAESQQSSLADPRSLSVAARVARSTRSNCWATRTSNGRWPMGKVVGVASLSRRHRRETRQYRLLSRPNPGSLIPKLERTSWSAMPALTRRIKKGAVPYRARQQQGRQAWERICFLSFIGEPCAESRAEKEGAQMRP